MKLLNKKFFLELGPNVGNLYREHTFDKGKDVKGKKFKKYSKKYGQRKRAGKLSRQSLEFKNTRAPVASGDLYTDFKFIKATSKGFTFGTVAHGGTVLALQDMGRVIATAKDPVPKHIKKFIEKEVAEYADKQLSKIKIDDVNLKL